jgi:kumamolisin
LQSSHTDHSVKRFGQTPTDPFTGQQPFTRPLCSAAWAATASHRDLDRICAHYRFPENLSGKGECIGILAFGGAVSESDLARYFQHLACAPDLRFEILGTSDLPNQNSRHDAETALDIQLAGGLAPGARIVTYFASNNEKGWADALDRVIHDRKNCPSVLIISWGATEDLWQPATLHALNDLFQQAARRGITVCVASGDDGCAQDSDGYCRVTFPASSPFVLACGGTSMAAGPSEVVWNVRNQNASGGGISDVLPRPGWQSILPPVPPPVPCRRKSDFAGRRLPDVAGPAGQGYAVYVGARYQNRIGGTSAVAPFWAALIARLNEGLRRQGRPRLGYFHPRLYQDRAIQQTFRGITSGHNDPYTTKGYPAGPGWNCCTGWGSPDGVRLLEVLCL